MKAQVASGEVWILGKFLHHEGVSNGGTIPGTWGHGLVLDDIKAFSNLSNSVILSFSSTHGWGYGMGWLSCLYQRVIPEGDGPRLDVAEQPTFNRISNPRKQSRQQLLQNKQVKPES